ncbi:MAG: cytochrome c oxidase subunit II [Halomonas sp.]|nr:cytochrome c oxidase subunit II [Halomonas sp.]MBR2514960.1 cytochrome c oxidase subunit II [Halomonas sp.]
MRERNCYTASRNIQRVSRQRVNQIALVTMLAAAGLTAGCAGDKSILDPAGQAARDVTLIWWIMLSFGTVVLVAVTALWLYAFRPREVTRTPVQERRIARRWILGGGIVLPVTSIIALLAFGVPAGQRMLAIDDSAEVIEVIGHQWWFEVRYPNAEGGEVVTANHLVMPVGEPVDFHVTGADVIHAFWIPRLGGKVDMIPGRVNRIRLEADIPAVFGAQCAEFCGVGHAHMHLFVEALPREEYDAWLAERQEEQLGAVATADASHDDARDAFMTHCASCHQVAGISSGTTGPNLSDMGSRATVGAGVMAMEEGAVSRWLKYHQSLKPGNRMPSHDDIETDTLDALGAWLETLSP